MQDNICLSSHTRGKNRLQKLKENFDEKFFQTQKNEKRIVRN